MDGIGYLIRKFRKIKNLTQKQLGDILNSSDVRIRQYELGMRNPKKPILKDISNALDISYEYLSNPTYPYSRKDLIAILFKAEDIISISPTNNNGIVFKDAEMCKMISDWKVIQEKLNNGEISLLEYDLWKATY
jgi:transcriptional regulator